MLTKSIRCDTISVVGRSLQMIRTTTEETAMTVTIAARWRVIFRVQSLARVTMPPPAATPAPGRPDLLALVQAQRLREALEAERLVWEARVLTSARRMS